ncbi:MAG: type 4a pilus biogenesis protein PilO [candidate division WOR-3 bacterium]|nr:MAG: type 4a pilus biogenesis protein PilO [candidate division WOR-3 bacterium]
MNLRESKTQQLVLFFFILILLLVVFFLVPHKNNRVKIAQLTSTRDSLQIEVQKAEQARARLPELQAKIARLEIEWEKAQEMLPQEKEIPSLIQQISNSGTKAGVSFLLFKPSGPVQKQNYSEIPVQIKVQCGYHQLGKFLSNIGNLARIVNVPSVKIKTGQKKSIEADLSAITYTVARGKEVQRAVPPRK